MASSAAELCVACVRQKNPYPNNAVKHGLCEQHFKFSAKKMLGYKNTNTGITSAKPFFDIFTKDRRRYNERMIPIVDFPFVSGLYSIFHQNGRSFEIPRASSKSGDDGIKKYEYRFKEGETLSIDDSINKALERDNILERPFVFFVHSKMPHTGIYILLDGNLYSVGYGFILFSEEIDPTWLYIPEEYRHGALFSPDIQLEIDQPSVILWIGLLTKSILQRLQDEMKLVTAVRFYTKQTDIGIDEKELEKIIYSLQKTKRGSSGEVQMTDAMKRLIYKDNKFVGHIFSGTYLDCGTINGYNNSLKKF